MVLSRPWVVVAALALLVLSACGPSAGQVRQAREARYQADGNVLFKAVVDAVADQRLKVAQADAAAGALATEPRWYEADGTFEDKTSDGNTLASDGAILLAYVIQLSNDGGTYFVRVLPHAAQLRGGYSAPFPLKEAEMPGWVSGKTDDLYVAIHQKLKAYEVKP